MNTDPGTLYVVATPIGNLDDITLRALHTLKSVSVIAAEDTRHTRGLLTHFGITTPLTSYHDHNKEEKAPVLVNRMKTGASIALVTDSGTPLISDPGYYLVNRCIDAGLPVSPVPGPSAPVAALSVSGLPTDAFIFIGFLPKKSGRRARVLESLAMRRETLIFFETPHRIHKILPDLLAALGDRRAVLAREMTKLHEETLRGTLSGILDAVKRRPPKGEITLVIAGAET
jgi:16S rRNA (cytidine1402-2'-O)-methyltransferase